MSRRNLRRQQQQQPPKNNGRQEQEYIKIRQASAKLNQKRRKQIEQLEKLNQQYLKYVELKKRKQANRQQAQPTNQKLRQIKPQNKMPQQKSSWNPFDWIASQTPAQKEAQQQKSILDTITDSNFIQGPKNLVTGVGEAYNSFNSGTKALDKFKQWKVLDGFSQLGGGISDAIGGSANLATGLSMTATSYLPVIAGVTGLAYLTKKARSSGIYTSYKQRKLIQAQQRVAEFVNNLVNDENEFSKRNKLFQQKYLTEPQQSQRRWRPFQRIGGQNNLEGSTKQIKSQIKLDQNNKNRVRRRRNAGMMLNVDENRRNLRNMEIMKNRR